MREKIISKNELTILRKVYPTNNVLQRERGLRFRIVCDDTPESFETVSENISL